MRKLLETWLEMVDAKLPAADPDYDAEAESARLEELRGTFMAELETQHEAYLDPEWRPNDDWWGSMAVED